MAAADICYRGAFEASLRLGMMSFQRPPRRAFPSLLACVGAAALLAAWGVFVRLNTSAEKLEPEAMEKAKEEDEKVHTT